MEQPQTGAMAGQATTTPVCAAAVIDRIAELEQLKNSAAAEQAKLSLELRGIREAEAKAQHRDVGKVGRSVAAEIGLARHESPHRGAQLLSVAWTLQHELPHTWKAFTAGKVSEYRVSLVVQETDCLTRTDKLRVDEALADKLPNLSNRGVITETRRLAYAIDPHSVVERHAKAERDRGVTLRPAPDGMARLSALVPVAQGVAMFASLHQAAITTKANGDPRTKNQVMADTLVSRVTGQETAEQVPVEVQVVITDLALFGLSDTPARIHGHGPVPAEIARRLAHTAAQHNLGWLRRLYVKPNSGELVGMESTARDSPRA